MLVPISVMVIVHGAAAVADPPVQFRHGLVSLTFPTMGTHRGSSCRYKFKSVAKTMCSFSGLIILIPRCSGQMFRSHSVEAGTGRHRRPEPREAPWASRAMIGYSFAVYSISAVQLCAVRSSGWTKDPRQDLQLNQVGKTRVASNEIRRVVSSEPGKWREI